MDSKIKMIIFFLTETLLWFGAAFMLSKTGITIASFMSINTFPLLGSILSMNFFIFILLIAMALGISLFSSKELNFKYAASSAFIASFLGLAVGSVILGSQEFIIPIIGGCIGLVLGIRFVPRREEELRYLKSIRAGNMGAGKATGIALIFLFLLLISVGFTNSEKYSTAFIPELLSITIGDGNSFISSIEEPLAQLAVMGSKQTLEMLKATPQFSALKEKNDVDGKGLTMIIEAASTDTAINATKEIVKTELRKQGTTINTTTELVSQMPMVKTVTQLIWVLYAMSALIIGGLLATIVNALAAILYVLLTSISNFKQKRLMK
jgi:hypothetical protein